MKSLKELYKIGYGPSSSHTIGPTRAAEWFLSHFPQALRYRVVLFGSMAFTGKGHGTETAIQKVFQSVGGEAEISSDTETPCPHPNTMAFYAFYADRTEKAEIRSVGGGDIEVVGLREKDTEPYREKTFAEIKEICKRENIALWQYAYEREKDIEPHIANVWQVMKDSIFSGLQRTGTLPGGLNVERRANALLNTVRNGSERQKENRLACAYAFAAGEQNASGEKVVTAPTCGACGVVPATFLCFQQRTRCSDEEIYKALLCAGVVGNVIKRNASISGAECGCQAEIGTACAMAAAGLAFLNGMDPDETECSAEIALEHHLGLTCDPIGGLVQIPCIERNAVATMRAMNAVDLATFITDSRKISLDTVIATMYETGCDLSGHYRETSTGGLAKHYKQC